jgi:hypothetical protein
MGAIYTQFLYLPIAGTAGATTADVATAWQKITHRLAAAPAYIAAGNALVTHPGIYTASLAPSSLPERPVSLRGL